MHSIDKSIKVVDRNGKILADVGKVMKDVTVEEFKKMLSSFAPSCKSNFINEIR